MMPGIDGIEVCRQLRTFSDAYVIMLTARTDEVDTLIGLSVGADDYMTKPFSPQELTARIRGLLRRPRTPVLTGGDPAVRTIGDLSLDQSHHSVAPPHRAVSNTLGRHSPAGRGCDSGSALQGRPNQGAVRGVRAYLETAPDKVDPLAHPNQSQVAARGYRPGGGGDPAAIVGDGEHDLRTELQGDQGACGVRVTHDVAQRLLGHPVRSELVL